IATGAGAEMRRSLGTAVFTGMLGVTLFGSFLTPEFFYVIARFRETQLFTADATRWIGSALLGGLLGLALAFLLTRLGIGRPPWAEVIGFGAGAMMALVVPTLWRRFRSV